MAKTGSPATKRKNSKSSLSLEQEFKKIVHISDKRENAGITEYLVKYEHSDEPAWTGKDEVDDDLVKKFETTLGTSTPLRRSGRVKVNAPPTSERKRKNIDEGADSKRVKKESPSPPITTTTTTSSFSQPSTPTESEHLRRGKSILTIDVNLKPKPPTAPSANDDEEEDDDEEKEEKEEKEAKEEVEKEEKKQETKKKRGKKAAKPKKIPQRSSSNSSSTVPSSPPTPRTEDASTHDDGFVGLCVGFASLQGYRPTMEDSHCIITDQKFNFVHQKYQDNPVHYFAVYDGHGGDKVAKYLADKLHPKIFSSELFLQGNFQQTYHNTFEEIDKEVSQHAWGGSTAACALLVGNTLTVANLGDAEVVLGYKRKADLADPTATYVFGHALLTHNVKPDDGQEARRVEAGGGQVTYGRVNGEVAVSRAFGDVTYKRPTWRTDLISAVPFINQTELHEQDRFLIISCDGLYEADVFTHESVVEYLGSLMKNNTTDPTALADMLAKEAIKRGSRDNVTVIVVMLSHD